MSDHSIFAPSGAHRNLKCFASLIADKSYPEKSSFEADEGTDAHSLAAIVLNNFFSNKRKMSTVIREYSELIKNKEIFILDKKESKIFIEIDMLEGITPYLKYIESIYNDQCIVLVEEEVKLDPVYGIEPGNVFTKSIFNESERDTFNFYALKGQKGTSDLIIYDTYNKILHVLDLKYGKGVVVEIVKNWQLLIYAAGALESLSKYIEVKEIDSITMGISQPRVKEEVSLWSLSVTDFIEEVNHTRRIFYYASEFYLNNLSMTFDYLCRSTVGNSPIFSPDDHTCKWCKGKSDCPGLIHSIEESIDSCFDDFTEDSVLPENIEKKILTSNDFKHKLVLKHDAIPLINQWCKSVHEMLYSRLLAGETGYGKKLVVGRRGKRTWVNTDKVIHLLKSMKYKTSEYFERIFISPAKCEKLLGKAKWKKIEEFSRYSEGKPIIVDENDPREAIDPIDFDDLTENEK